MATTSPGPPTELEELEAHAEEHLSEAGLREIGLIPPEEEPEEAPIPTLRLAVVVSFCVLAAAIMTGGVFIGVTPRINAAVAGVIGVALGVLVNRVRRPALMYSAIVLGIFAVGLLLVVPTGFGNIFDLKALTKQAATIGDVRRPPVEFTPGWRAIVGWLMGGLGFASAWVATEIRRPALGVMLPLPVVMITAISVPDSDQVASGIVSLALFVVGLGLLSGTQLGGHEPLSLAFEIRRAAKGLPLIAVITGGLYLLAQYNFLFPPPLYDPSQEPQKPQTVPLSDVKDRVLFQVKSSITGPWKMGNLDVYDGEYWRLPPFAESKLEPVKRSGVVDPELQPGVRADYVSADLGGAVLPGLPNTVGIIAEGPKLAYDARTGNIRLHQGTVQSGLRYTVVAAQIPKVEELRAVNQPVPDEIKPYLKIPPPPPAVEDLLDKAPTTSGWDRMDFLRLTFLKTVVASGAGTPVGVPPSKVQDMLAGSKQGTPFEIVAAQAMLARWAGVPSRIGYGFDGGNCAGEDRPPPCSDKDAPLEVRPKHGASFLEVYFPTYKWLPVIGTPIQAKSSLGSEYQQFNPNVAASDEVAVRILVPVALDPKSLLYAQIRRLLEIALPIIAVVLLIYYGYPFFRKAVLRSRTRNWAQAEGPAARIALAYAEWRDTGVDFGYRFDSDTPLMFLDRVVEDAEHTELAWLVTRTLWGDLRDQVGSDDGEAAEELAAALRKRLAQGHPWTLRAIAALSRLSLRFPYAPALGVHNGREQTDARAA